jgi:hypothetical protein
LSVIILKKMLFFNTNTAPVLKLSRYLYNLQEVKIKFITSILSKDDLNECYFWIYEIYFSNLKNETIDILLDLYYQYYALINPTEERKIKEIINSDEDNELIPGKIVKILFTLDYNIQVFSIIQLINNIHYNEEQSQPKLINLLHIKLSSVSFPRTNNNVIEYIKSLNEIYHKLFISIYKKSYIDICISLSIFIYTYKDDKYNLNKIYNEINELYKNIKLSNKTKSKKDLIYHFNKININENDKIDSVSLSILNTTELIYKIIIYTFNIYFKTNSSPSYIQETPQRNLTSNDIKYIFSLIEQDYNFRKERTDCFLKTKRLYFIHDTYYYLLGSFNLLRYNESNFINQEKYINDTLLDWEFYAYNTPIWRERFNKYKGIYQPTKKRIEFDIDDNIEKFYEIYGYELDEQYENIYDLYIIDKYDYKTWIVFLSNYINDIHKQDSILTHLKNNNVKMNINETAYKTNFNMMYDYKNLSTGNLILSSNTIIINNTMEPEINIDTEEEYNINNDISNNLLYIIDNYINTSNNSHLKLLLFELL